MIKFQKVLKHLIAVFFITVGAFLATIGLNMFLVPNNIIDGGVVGISIMLSSITKFKLGFYIIILNLPFLLIGYKLIGKTFAFYTLYSIVALSVWSYILDDVPLITNEMLLAAIFGGIVLGIGVGLIIRYGGSLDGTEIVAIIMDRKSGFSLGEIVMFFNIFILSSAVFVYGWEEAMYSIITYFIAFKVIDITIEGLNETRAVIIVTTKEEDITSQLMNQLGRGITILNGVGAYSHEEKSVLYAVITRLEISKLKQIVNNIDEQAFVTISQVHEVLGGLAKN
ncbi:YitT family protein [Haloplasma contractile]|uniref:Membrane protein putative n=1 Tax=Haloplasma contractile SSD-17B TaxID=1033810 RepID=U2FJP8_9MOLU|nr:YitT family protein [Haloplasma contractile]ERJ13035.1 Membrane protein putative [Haloplasma contractile SSD-17B]